MSEQPTAARSLSVQCAIAGGGPAGMMLGFLLARAGVSVVVLEKHGDFLRDFRGDTIHPSTLEVMNDVGLLDDLLRLPHQKAHVLRGQVGEKRVTLADFSHLPATCKYVAFMPQWDFLSFLAEQAKRYPTFQLSMNAEVVALVEGSGRVTGLRARTPEGTIEIAADLVVGADGRGSAVRALAGLHVEDLGAPMDVLWMRLSHRPNDGCETMGRIRPGSIFVTIDRGEYWQCGLVIPKGGLEEIRQKGLPALRDRIAELAPELRGTVSELATWDDVKLLTVRVDRLERWYRPGLLCIGDAAHAMSPIGGVGINLAVQDAVAAANILAAPLHTGAVTTAELTAVERRREPPTRITQRAQLFLQDRVVSRALGSGASTTTSFVLELLERWPFLQRIPARTVGIGVRPERVRTPEVGAREHQAR